MYSSVKKYISFYKIIIASELQNIFVTSYFCSSKSVLLFHASVSVRNGIKFFCEVKVTRNQVESCEREIICQNLLQLHEAIS